MVHKETTRAGELVGLLGNHPNNELLAGEVGAWELELSRSSPSSTSRTAVAASLRPPANASSGSSECLVRLRGVRRSQWPSVSSLSSLRHTGNAVGAPMFPLTQSSKRRRWPRRTDRRAVAAVPSVIGVNPSRADAAISTGRTSRRRDALRRQRVPVEVTEARGTDHHRVAVRPGPPHREVVLEVLGGQVGSSDLRDVLIRQPTARMRVHGDQLVLAQDQRVQAGVGITAHAAQIPPA